MQSQRTWVMAALRRVVQSCGLVAVFLACAGAAADTRPGMRGCRLEGLERSALCGSVTRPLAIGSAKGEQIEVHFAVLPSLSRNRKPDPVFFFAGGPGQSAIELAPQVNLLMARLNNRRDVVLIDQRGTGQSAPLRCDAQPSTAPLSQLLLPAAQRQRRAQCLQQLQALPYGDLRHFSTWSAAQDVDAVRAQLGAPQINLVGISYGTRVALEYLRQYPLMVRRMVLDGVAPADMVLPSSASGDGQAVLNAWLQSCEANPACKRRYPDLRRNWQATLASLPKPMQVAHPVTGVVERLTVTRELVVPMVRAALYVPALASGVPAAVDALAQGRLEPLVALASALQAGGGGHRRGQLYEGMHLSVLCSEDLARLGQSTEEPGQDFGDVMAQHYKASCEGWPRARIPSTFFTFTPTPAATLVLSGGADPVTPPRHGQRVAEALGPKARHVPVENAGHGVLNFPCMRDVSYRFINAATDALALDQETTCAAQVPRPPVFLPFLGDQQPEAVPESKPATPPGREQRGAPGKPPVKAAEGKT